MRWLRVGVAKTAQRTQPVGTTVCSRMCHVGDGTIRKAADILRRWSPQPALELHAVQLAILQRGLFVSG